MSVTVRITCPLENVRIYYTLDGTIPTSNSMIYNPSEPIFIDTIGYTTIKAIGRFEGYEDSDVVEKTYNVVERCSKPTIIPNGGTFAGSIHVSLSSSTSGTTIHYTLDGTTPTETSLSADGGEVVIDHSSTLKVIAIRPGTAVSQVASASFTILPKVATPVISPSTNIFAISATLKITCSTPNATIYYTTDGEDPNESSLRVDRHMPDIIIDIPGQHTVKAFATFPTMLASDLVTKSFLIMMRASAPTLFPNPGTYTGTLNIRFDCADEDGGIIYYTIDGITTPTISSPHVSCGDSVALPGHGKYTIRSFRASDSKAPSAFVEGIYILLRPPYDTFPINPNSTYQMKPDIDVFVVEKNLKPTGYYESRYCGDRNVRGRLVVLHNPVGHFDILEPLNGCGAGFVLPSISGRDWKKNGDKILPSVSRFYKDKIESLRREDIEKWNINYSNEQSKHCDVVTNAGFFNISSSACFGDVVTNGKVVQTSELHNVNFGIRNGTFVIGYVESSEILGSNMTSDWIGFDTLISGLVWLVRDGEVYVTESLHPQYGAGEDMTPQTAGSQFASVLSARTAIGFDDRGRLLILQVEGETWIRGMSLYEFAAFAKELGFVSAINLDGGGSATMTVNQTLVSEPSWKCSRVKALTEYHELVKSNFKIDEMKRSKLLQKWRLDEDQILEVDLDGDGLRYCEKPVTTVACMHPLAPPEFISLPPTVTPSGHPTSSPSIHVEHVPSPQSIEVTTTSPTLLPVTRFPTPLPTVVNSTAVLSEATMSNSLSFYRMASIGLLIALLVSLSFNFLACVCLMTGRERINLSKDSTSSLQNIEMIPSQSSQPNGGYNPSSPRTQSTPSNHPHSTPLSVPSSNSWQTKFKSMNLSDESDDEDIHRIVVNRSPVREENDEEDATETEQFFKPNPSKNEKNSTGFFSSKFKSSKSKHTTEPPISSHAANWREELDDEEMQSRHHQHSSTTASPKFTSKNDDGDHNPTSGGWLKRKKKHSKKKSIGEGDGDIGDDVERGGR